MDIESYFVTKGIQVRLNVGRQFDSWVIKKMIESLAK